MATERRLGRSALALLAGFLAVVALSLGTDLIFYALGKFPAPGRPMSDERWLLLATVYRSVYGVLGGFITARVAPYRPVAHALTGGAIGFVLSIVGAVVTWNNGPEFGPHWYPVSLMVTALPSAWLGGVLGRRPQQT